MNADATPSNRRFAWATLGASAVAVLMFATLSWHIHRHAAPAFDAVVMHWFQQHRTPFMFGLMTFVSWLGGTFVVVAVTALAALAFWLTGRFKTEGGVMLGAMAGGLALMEGMKFLFPRPRAEHRYDHLGGVADDIILVGLTLRWVMKAVPANVVREHWDGPSGLFALLDRARTGLRAGTTGGAEPS